MSSAATESKFINIAKRKHKVVIRFVGDPIEAGRERLDEFKDAYTDMLARELEKSSSTKASGPRLVILFDLRHFKVNILDPKQLAVVKELTTFFIKLRPVSEQIVEICAAALGSSAVAGVVQSALDINPGAIPSFVDTDIERCKAFLKRPQTKK